MTAQSLIDLFRTEIKDDETPYRVSDTTALSFLNQALLETRRLRIDAFWANGPISFETVTASTLKDELALLPSLSEYVAYYMAYRALGLDSDHPGNAAMSANYYTKFKTGITA